MYVIAFYSVASCLQYTNKLTYLSHCLDLARFHSAEAPSTCRSTHALLELSTEYRLHLGNVTTLGRSNYSL